MRTLVTAVGCPGASTLIRNLRKHDPWIYIHGTDMDNTAIGKWLCNSFTQVPPGKSTEYTTIIQKLYNRYKIDAIFPQSSNEVEALSLLKEAQKLNIAVSSPQAVRTCLSKYSTYATLEKNCGKWIPKWRPATNIDELREALEELGYPDRPVVIKPPEGKGSRGVRIVKEMNRRERERLLRYEKPAHKYITLEELENTLDPENVGMLAVEYIEGQEKTVDCLCYNGTSLIMTVKTVERTRCGVITRGTLVKDPELEKATRRILREIPLSYCVNVQFIGNKLVEINPRVSTIIDQPDFYTPYLAIQIAAGKLDPDPENFKAYKPDIGRRMTRYMDMVTYK